MLYPVILSGGVGKRLWPVSSQSNPKQFHKFFNNQTLLQNTYDRLVRGFDQGNIFLVTNINSLDSVKSQLDISEDNIILEPDRCDTAMAIGIAAAKLTSVDDKAMFININSDAYIKEVDKYLEVVKKAAKVAEQEDKMVLVGIKPSYPETGYGYIEPGDKIDNDLFEVKSFKEKPDKNTAQEYIDKGFLWNPTLLVFPAKKLLEWYKEYLPDMYQSLVNIMDSDFDKGTIAKEYSRVNKISIDYGLLEKMTDMLVMPADISWSDIGSWRSLRDVVSEGENVANTKSVSIDSKSNLFYSSSDKLVASIGVEGMVLVETDDVIFLCPAERSQEVKELLANMKKENLDKYL